MIFKNYLCDFLYKYVFGWNLNIKLDKNMVVLGQGLGFLCFQLVFVVRGFFLGFGVFMDYLEIIFKVVFSYDIILQC